MEVREVTVLMVLTGKQRRPRLKRRYCPRHFPHPDSKLAQTDMFLGCPEVKCTCARQKAREWWVVTARTAREAMEACRAWPSIVNDARILHHGREGQAPIYGNAR